MDLYSFRKSGALLHIIQGKFWEVKATGFASKDSDAIGGDLSLILMRVCYALQKKRCYPGRTKDHCQRIRAKKQVLKGWFQSFGGKPISSLLSAVRAVACICLFNLG